MFKSEKLPEPINFFSENGLELIGKGKWRTTKCIFHGGSDSMRVNVSKGAWVCMAGCGARGGDVLSYYMAVNGVDFVSAAKALGAWDEASAKPSVQHKPKPISCRDALEIMIAEINLLALAVLSLSISKSMPEQDRQRIIKAVSRINMIAEYFRD